MCQIVLKIRKLNSFAINVGNLIILFPNVKLELIHVSFLFVLVVPLITTRLNLTFILATIEIPLVNPYPFAKCFVCGDMGHLSGACEKNVNGLYPNGGGCKYCGDKTHLAKDCKPIQQGMCSTYSFVTQL